MYSNIRSIVFTSSYFTFYKTKETQNIASLHDDISLRLCCFSKPGQRQRVGLRVFRNRYICLLQACCLKEYNESLPWFRL